LRAMTRIPLGQPARSQHGQLSHPRALTDAIVVGHDRLTAPVHRGVQACSWDRVDHLADSTYFAVPLEEHVEFNFNQLEPEEVGNVLAAGWWTPAALAGVAFRPPELPEIMSTALTACADRPR
jgi:hypothetical protein